MEFLSNLKAEPRNKQLKLNSLLEPRDSGGNPEFAWKKVVASCPIQFLLHHQLFLPFSSMLCERGWRGKWWFWRKITQTAYYNIILCSVTWLGTRICIPRKTLLFTTEKKIVSKLEREKHRQDQNKNSRDIIVTSINFKDKFINTIVLCSRKRFKN